MELNVSQWENYIHCRIDEWFIIFMSSSGLAVGIMYQIFGVLCWIMYNNSVGKRLHSHGYWAGLALVFHACGIIHFSHTYGKIYPELLLGSFAYLILGPCMVFLIVVAIKDFRKWRHLRTDDEMEVMKANVREEIKNKLINRVYRLPISDNDRQNLLKNL